MIQRTGEMSAFRYENRRQASHRTKYSTRPDTVCQCLRSSLSRIAGNDASELTYPCRKAFKVKYWDRICERKQNATVDIDSTQRP